MYNNTIFNNNNGTCDQEDIIIPTAEEVRLELTASDLLLN
jgi:hypothetical protein